MVLELFYFILIFIFNWFIFYFICYTFSNTWFRDLKNKSQYFVFLFYCKQNNFIILVYFIFIFDWFPFRINLFYIILLI